MRGVRLILWLVVGAAALGQPGIPQEEYRARRAELRQALPEGGVVLFGRAEKRDPDATMLAVRQDPSFLYLTGWEEPGAILLMWPPDGEAFFLPPRNERTDRYTGRQTTADEPHAPAVTGFSQVFETSSFEPRLRELLESHPKLYALAGTPAATRLREMLPGREPEDARPALVRLRVKKSPREVELIQHAIDVTVAAQRAAWRRVQPGIFEYQVAATFTAEVMERGCVGPAFAPIVASGPNGMILHYGKSGRRSDAGEVLVLDLGAECYSYGADITRTVPVNGRFTARQRELYEIVLGAQKAVIAAIMPGVTQGPKRDTPNSLYKVAHDYINSHGKDRAGDSLGKYLPHGVSHHVGLQTHDPGAADQPLQAGAIITVEPGIYIPEEGIGIRIEDMVLVTERGARLLTSALPREPGEVEKAMAAAAIRQPAEGGQPRGAGGCACGADRLKPVPRAGSAEELANRDAR
ncbi:MAG: aminopeptidase P family protein [Acidobacteria bacterium]|nr:aminopeptidase P family protein [Acidobacteriota bacterium]